MKRAQAWLRRLALGLLLMVLALATLTAHAVSEGEREMSLSDRAFDEGDVRQATYHARRAAIYYAPGAPHVRAAYLRLRAVAVGAEAAGDTDVALFAWRATRSAALETRHVSAVHSADLDEANRALARLQVATSQPDTMLEVRKMRKVALRDLTLGSNRTGFILLLVLGFCSAGGGLLWLALRAVLPDGTLRASEARWAGLVSLLGLACWVWAVVAA